MINRKDFLKLGSLASASMLIPEYTFGANSSKKETTITILHTNDQHSRIEPFEPSNKLHGNNGGFARRFSLIENIRKQKKNVILLDAGDIFQGTPFFNYFGGELEFKLMSKMDYLATTIGNHDLDNGLEGLLKQLPHAKFDFICSNYDFSNTILEGRTKKYKIINKDGIKVGIFGLGIELNGLVSKHNFKETKYLNPIEIATDYSTFLKKEKKCDLIICLSHLGYFFEDNKSKICDLEVAKNTEFIDLFIGGHTHTFLDKPTEVINKSNKKVLVNQVGWAGLVLGQIDFHFSNNQIKNISYNNSPIVESYI